MIGTIAGGPRAADGSPVVSPAAYAYSSEAVRFQGQLCPCSAGANTFDLRLEKQVRLQGGLFWSHGALAGDTVTLQVIDKDGVVSAAGTVLATYVNAMPLAPFDYVGELEAPTAASIVAGLYLRVVVTHAGPGCSLGITYRWFEVA